jgi:hypothetical protein
MLDTRSADEATPDATETRRRLVGWREQDPVPGSLGSLVTRRWREPDSNPPSHPSAAGGTSIRLIRAREVEKDSACGRGDAPRRIEEAIFIHSGDPHATRCG